MEAIKRVGFAQPDRQAMEDAAIKEKRFGDKVKLHIADYRDRAHPKILEGWENLDVLRSEGNHEQIKQRLDAALEQQRPHLNEAAYRPAYMGEMWIQSLPEACKRLNSDEAYRKQIAKRQF